MKDKWAQCKSCIGYCCFGSASYSGTPISDGEIKTACKYLDIPEEQFRTTYVTKFRPSGGYVQGLRFGTQPCPFWTPGKCTIYKVRPSFCRKYNPIENCEGWHKARAGV